MAADFADRLARLADVTVEIGLGLRPGQRLLMRAPLEAAPFVRQVAERAYRSGCRLVDVLWHDDGLRLIRFAHAPRDSFTEFPAWHRAAYEQAVAAGDAILLVHAADPDLLAGQDAELVMTAERTQREQLRDAFAEAMQGRTNWTTVSVPIPGWAARVFPELDAAQRCDRLWEAVFRACRADRDDPVAAWREHLAELARRRALLTEAAFTRLRLRGPGTDLEVGLAPGHLWRGGALEIDDLCFVPNLPTEEVFTFPHKDRVDGRVAATKPFDFGGHTIDGMRLTFAAGQVTESTATRGEDFLHQALATDPGASRLGEIALLPHSSPVSQTGILFHNVLFDENASCHLALGKAFQICVRGGEELSADEFAAVGGNDSLLHLDFMIGSADLDVDGCRDGGEWVPVMRAGEWA